MEKQLKTIRWGIIGLGNIAHKFASDILTVEGSELHAVASRSQEKAEAFALKYKAPKAFSSYEALANDPDLDAVYIATPHALHKDNTIMCLKKGIAVLCEKPFAMDSKEVYEMIAVAKQENILLMEALWTYFLPHYRYVLEELKKGTYGKVVRLETDFGFYREFNDSARLFNKSLGGGSLLDIGIYPIFAALSILGLPNRIEANATFFDNTADSSCSMVFHYPNNVTAHLKSSLVEDLDTEAVIYCEKGTIKMNRQFHTPTTVTILTQDSEQTLDFICDEFGYKYEIAHFSQLIREGKTESEIMTLNFSKKLIKTLDDVSNIIGLSYK